jgi:hypothetical protein
MQPLKPLELFQVVVVKGKTRCSGWCSTTASRGGLGAWLACSETQRRRSPAPWQWSSISNSGHALQARAVPRGQDIQEPPRRRVHGGHGCRLAVSPYKHASGPLDSSAKGVAEHAAQLEWCASAGAFKQLYHESPRPQCLTEHWQAARAGRTRTNPLEPEVAQAPAQARSRKSMGPGTRMVVTTAAFPAGPQACT